MIRRFGLLSFILMLSIAFEACGPEEEADTVITNDTVTGSAINRVVDTVEFEEPEFVPDFYVEGTFLKIFYGTSGDFLKVRDTSGTERNFYAGIIPNEAEIVQYEYMFRNREVRIGYVERAVPRPELGDTAFIDSLVTTDWIGFARKIGDGPDQLPFQSVYQNLREGDTLHFPAGRFVLPESIKIWGINRIAFRGSRDGSTILVVKNGPVMDIQNSEQIALLDLGLEVESDSAATCTGLMKIQNCTRVRLSNVSGESCEKAALSIANCENVRFRNVEIKGDHPFMVDDVEYLIADSLPGITVQTDQTLSENNK